MKLGKIFVTVLLLGYAGLSAVHRGHEGSGKIRLNVDEAMKKKMLKRRSEHHDHHSESSEYHRHDALKGRHRGRR